MFSHRNYAPRKPYNINGLILVQSIDFCNERSRSSLVGELEFRHTRQRDLLHEPRPFRYTILQGMREGFLCVNQGRCREFGGSPSPGVIGVVGSADGRLGDGGHS